MTVRDFELAEKQFCRYQILPVALNLFFVLAASAALLFNLSSISEIGVLAGWISLGLYLGAFVLSAYLMGRLGQRKLKELGLVCEGCGEVLGGEKAVTLCGVCPKCKHQVLEDAPYVRRNGQFQLQTGIPSSEH
jgi:hypothetical protein